VLELGQEKRSIDNEAVEKKHLHLLTEIERKREKVKE